MDAYIVGAAQTAYTRHVPPELTIEHLLADVFTRLLKHTGISPREIDGIGVSSFTLQPDHAADLAWRLGVRARWLMEDTNGGAAALNMLQHARRAIEAGDARTIVLLAGDRLDRESFSELVNTYNRATIAHLAPIPIEGPNTLFALLTQQHMTANGLSREDYGRLVIAQRNWASANPEAIYREPLTMEDYLNAPIVAPPLCRYDCAPVVSGADAIIVSAHRSKAVARIRSIRANYNFDGQEGDGLRTGLSEIAPELWHEAGYGPDSIDAAYVYDDYPAMIVVQLEELGLIPKGESKTFLRQKLPPINTSGGQLSAGQAGAAGGMHGLVEAVRQLLGTSRGHRIFPKRVVVTGYGMILYRYGACANAAVLESA